MAIVSTINIPASEIQAGDILTITATINTPANAPHSAMIYIESGEGDRFRGSVAVDPQMLADPDAEAIESMALAINATYVRGEGGVAWDELAEKYRDEYRDEARAALAAYREFTTVAPPASTWTCVYGRCEGARFTGTPADAAAWMDQHMIDRPHDDRWANSFRIDVPGRDLPDVVYRSAVTL